jgi:orotate phosphoribosyltransferase
VQVTDTRSLRRLLVSPHSGVIDRLLEIIQETGTLLEGHFELDPSRHTPYFVRFSEIGWKQRLVEEVATMLLEVAPFVSKPATIVCAETSAIFLAQALGRKTGNPVAVTAVDTARHPTSRLRTGMIDGASPILVVSDVITTGRSLIPLLDLKPSPGEITGVVAFAVLSTARFAELARSRRIEAEWLLASTWETNRPHPLDCSGCASRAPLLHASEFS